MTRPSCALGWLQGRTLSHEDVVSRGVIRHWGGVHSNLVDAPRTWVWHTLDGGHHTGAGHGPWVDDEASKGREDGALGQVYSKGRVLDGEAVDSRHLGADSGAV